MGQDISSFPRPNSNREWTNKIGQCSFRGVVIEVRSITMQFGRRGTVHSFPFKDETFAEDVGRAPRIFTLSGFVDGDNYLTRKQNVIDAIELLDTPGTFILPDGKEFRVKPSSDCTTTFNNNSGGVESFTLKFTEAGSQSFPRATTNTRETTILRGDELVTALKAEATDAMDFEQTLPDSTEGINDPDSLADKSVSIVDAFNETIDKVIETGLKAGNAIDKFARKFTDYKNDVRTLILDPASLLDETDSVYTDLRGVYALADAATAFESFRDIFNSAVDDIGRVIGINDPSRKQNDKNNQTLRDSSRNMLLRHLANITTDQVYISTNQVDQRRTDILALFAQQIENAANNFDQCQRATLVELRSSVVADLDSKLGALPDEVIFTPPDTMPAAVIANQLYADGLRGNEIAEANGNINPNLLPARIPLNVLSA